MLEERFAGGVSDANKDTQTTVDGAAARVQWLWDVRYIDAPVLRWRDTNADGTLDETLYYCNDANMNATALVGTSGTVVERYLYDPYGKVSVYDGSWSAVTWANSKQNEVLFAGYRLDPESGLYHVRHRYYHPTLGRWIERDPTDYSGSMRQLADAISLYEYVTSNPVDRADPLGLKEVSVSAKSEWTLLIAGDPLKTTNWVEAELKAEVDDCCHFKSPPAVTMKHGERLGWTASHIHEQGPDSLISNRKCPKDGHPVECYVYMVDIKWDVVQITRWWVYRIKPAEWQRSVVGVAICADGYSDWIIVPQKAPKAKWSHQGTGT